MDERSEVTPWRSACRHDLKAGLLFGALLFGGPISVVHLLHNRTTSPGVGLAALLLFGVLYGACGGLVFWGVGWLLRTVARLRQRGPVTPAVQAACLFNVVFLELFLFHGLTWEQAPRFASSSLAAMIGLVAVGALLTAATVWLVTRALAAAVLRLGAAGRLGGTMLAATACLVAAHVAVPLSLRFATEPEETAFDPTLLTVQPGPDVALLGFDGMDPDLFLDLVDAGELPALAELVREGAFGRLETLRDANSAVIWASIYTGETERRHGIRDFYRIRFPGSAGGLFPVHRTGFKEMIDLLHRVPGISRRFVSRLDLASPPVWEIADRAGLPTVVVDGYFYSFPAQPQAGPSSQLLAYGLQDALADPAVSERKLSWFAQPPDLKGGIREAATGRTDLDWQHRAAIALLERRARLGQPPSRFFNLYTHEPDTVSHQRWRWLEPERFPFVSRTGVERHGDAVVDVYRRIDSLVADLRQSLGPDAVLVIASDHGQSPTFLHRLHTQHRHGPDGLLLLHGPGIREGHMIEGSHVLDVFPTVLALLGLPVAEDASGRVLEEAFDRPADPSGRPRIPTYRNAWQPVDTVGGPDAERTRQELERLKAMGYL